MATLVWHGLLFLAVMSSGVFAQTVVCTDIDTRFGRASCGADYYDLSTVWLKEWSAAL